MAAVECVGSVLGILPAPTETAAPPNAKSRHVVMMGAEVSAEPVARARRVMTGAAANCSVRGKTAVWMAVVALAEPAHKVISVFPENAPKKTTSSAVLVMTTPIVVAKDSFALTRSFHHRSAHDPASSHRLAIALKVGGASLFQVAQRARSALLFESSPAYSLDCSAAQ